ncbi:MAG TPA: GreA/GreB family elongation factor [Rectinemataceae bacterium]|nr:GreA/GreB family elongation factor [Rectinemataceae bacterium]
MSRAFVDEDGGSDEAGGLFDIPLPLPAGAKNYMTPEGASRMADELRRLVDSDRPRALAALAAAAQADKATSIRHLSEIDRRISYLGRMQSSLEVVSTPATTERIVFGLAAKVSEGDGKEREYRIVGVDESDPENGLLSWASPIAKALIGKRVGEIAVAHLPVGERRMRILAISFPARGD